MTSLARLCRFRVLAAVYVAYQLVVSIIAVVSTGLDHAIVQYDSYSYFLQSKEGWTSLGLWSNDVLTTYPVVLKIFGTGLVLVLLQVAISAVSWLALAREVSKSTQRPGVGFAGAAWLLGMSLVPSIAYWNYMVMTESLSISGLIALTALAIRWLRTGDDRLMYLSLPLIVLWVNQRGSNFMVVFAAAVVIGFWGMRDHRRPLIAFSLLSIMVVGSFASLHHASQSQLTFKWVATVGLQDPQTRDFLVERGMPYDDAVRDLVAYGPDQRDVSDVVAADPRLDDFRAWVGSESTSAFRSWLLSDPGQLVWDATRSFGVSLSPPIETLDQPALALVSLNEGIGFTGTSAKLPFGRTAGQVFWVGNIAALGLWTVYTTAFAIVALRLRPNRWRHPMWKVAWFQVVLVPVGLVASYFGDIAAPERHGLGGAVQLRIGLVLLTLWCIDSIVGKRAAPGPEPGGDASDAGAGDMATAATER